jgi:hypothetical protein
MTIFRSKTHKYNNKCSLRICRMEDSNFQTKSRNSVHDEEHNFVTHERSDGLSSRESTWIIMRVHEIIMIKVKESELPIDFQIWHTYIHMDTSCPFHLFASLWLVHPHIGSVSAPVLAQWCTSVAINYLNNAAWPLSEWSSSKCIKLSHLC